MPVGGLATSSGTRSTLYTCPPGRAGGMFVQEMICLIEVDWTFLIVAQDQSEVLGHCLLVLTSAGHLGWVRSRWLLGTA